MIEKTFLRKAMSITIELFHKLYKKNMEILTLKNKINKTIDELYEKFAYSGGDSYFEVNNHYYETDTGYAIEGIEFFIKELKEELNKISLSDK